ncbi:hypothetical protein KUTeg_015578 [Tegillarca granosa]|uniref:Uncharacterized protein n=1 Tax=Tegillarca granosa TaxID=220873 RepID=A0ABQ9EQI6_TEGGR|nr:hypothetical protein KUTeg_015578 [Tegillarca granosa]
MEKRQLSPVIDTYGATQDDFNELLKRGSLLRFGKRGSLLRFGKRGSLLRFGKRGSLLRFGKRYDEDMPVAGWIPSAYLEEPSDEDIKRSSLLRFGKKSALFRYGRSADNAPHTPFRFGRQEVEG